ncbi:MAG TPA: glucose-6-phosphate dehydrogenase [Candidatus Limnocylindria bacterium]|nr:glucose-6-phosphate dehydrogenase [Candidatus Limnocylindria bacterium]
MTAATVANPLREGLRLSRIPEPSTIVIFGGSGDLAQRKLIPALYNLALQRLLPATFSVVGTARRPLTDEQYREELRAAVAQHSRTKPLNEEVWRSFAEHLHFVATPDDHGYEELRRLLDRLDLEVGTHANRLFYLATPPSAYEAIVKAIGEHGLRGETGWARIVVEKPFGHDRESARELTEIVHAVFREDEIFRIDHYLGKETVQNILVMRFANGIFEPIWGRQYVDHVQITVAESIGVEERAGYYEQAGAMRDIVQNHLLQLVSLVAMEPPSAFDDKAVRDEKVKVLRALRPIVGDDVYTSAVRGQYTRGFIEGVPVPGYREEPGVAPDSRTETYVALKCWVDNWRWEGTPFYVRTGKRLPKRSTEIAIQFRVAPHQLFSREASAGLEPNALVLRIQPDEGISLKFGAKVPVQGIRIRSVNMDFDYGASFMVDAPDAYETLILDALRGDATLFTRRDEVDQQWAFVDPIIKTWALSGAPSEYEAGTWGPPEADVLIERDGRAWRKA